ncbi:hypothetical protein SLEP1_g60153, partial [Rubroshorea leprosula]
GHLSYDVWASI